MEYIAHIVILTLLYVTLATSLRVLVGEIGQLSFAHAAFYGIGAYTSALLATRTDLPFVVALFASMGVAALVSLLISVPSLRLYKDYFVLATFGFPIIMTGVLTNWSSVTGGPDGISGIPPVMIVDFALHPTASALVLALLIAVCSHLVVRRLVTSPFGRVLRAIREDEDLVAAYGRNPTTFKISVVAVTSALAGAAGSIYAYYIGFIDPSGFTIIESILILSMVIIGGARSMWGPVVGAVTLVIFPELLRFIGIPMSIAAEMRQMLYGLLLVLTMILRPQGIVGNYRIKQ